MGKPKEQPLDAVDLTASLDRETYKKQLRAEQTLVRELAYKMYLAKR